MLSESTPKAKTASLPREIYVVLGFIGMLFVGVIYAWSVIKAPMMKEFGWNQSQVAFAYTLSICFFCIGCVLGAILDRHFSPRMILVVAGVLLGGGLWLTTFANGNLYLLYFSYSFCVGIGAGIANNTLMVVVSGWFPDKQGTVSGLMMMGCGLSALFIGKLMNYLFSAPNYGWRYAYRLIGSLAFAALIICALILKQAKNDAPARAAAKKAVAKPIHDYTFAETLRSPSYWIFYVYGILGAATGSTVISFSSDLAQFLGASVALATTLVGVLSVFNGLGRILCGILFDKWGSSQTMTLISGFTVAACGTMIIALLTDSFPLAVLSFCVTGLSYGGLPTLSSAFLLRHFGRKDYALNFGFGNTKVIISSFVATLAGSMLTRGGSYLSVFWMLLALAACAMVLNTFLVRLK